MKTLKVTELLGTPVLLAAEKGDELSKHIRNSLGLLTRSIEVDFSGYQFLSSAFLNHAFGQMCIDEEWDVEKFHRTIKITGLDEDDKDELSVALDNAQTRLRMLKKGIKPEELFERIPA